MFGSKKKNKVDEDIFKVGDIVELKSESFAMTIVGIIDNCAEVVWANEECQVYRNVFSLEALERSERRKNG